MCMRAGQRREEGKRFREWRRGHGRKRAGNEEELCIIKAGLNEICMQIHLSGRKSAAGLQWKITPQFHDF